MIRTLIRRKPSGAIAPPSRAAKVCPLCHKKRLVFIEIRRIQICRPCFDWVSGKAKGIKPKRKRVRDQPKGENPQTRKFCDCGEKATVMLFREMVCQRCKDLTGEAAYWATRDFDGIESKISDQGDLPTLHISFPDAHIPDEHEHRRWNASTAKQYNKHGEINWIYKSSLPNFRTNNRLRNK